MIHWFLNTTPRNPIAGSPEPPIAWKTEDGIKWEPVYEKDLAAPARRELITNPDDCRLRPNRFLPTVTPEECAAWLMSGSGFSFDAIRLIEGRLEAIEKELARFGFKLSDKSGFYEAVPYTAK